MSDTAIPEPEVGAAGDSDSWGEVVRVTHVSELLDLHWIRLANGATVRAIYARRAIPAGTLVEECPVVPIYPDEYVRAVAVRNYAFAWKIKEGGRVRTVRALALGMAAVYNHAIDANLQPVHVLDEFRLEFWAARDIAAGEELTHDYKWGGHGNRMNPVDRYLRPMFPNRSMVPPGI